MISIREKPLQFWVNERFFLDNTHKAKNNGEIEICFRS